MLISVQLITFFVFIFQKELAKIITLEQGKTLADAEGDVFRGLRKYNLLTRVKKKKKAIWLYFNYPSLVFLHCTNRSLKGAVFALLQYWQSFEIIMLYNRLSKWVCLCNGDLLVPYASPPFDKVELKDKPMMSKLVFSFANVTKTKYSSHSEMILTWVHYLVTLP